MSSSELLGSKNTFAIDLGPLAIDLGPLGRTYSFATIRYWIEGRALEGFGGGPTFLNPHLFRLAALVTESKWLSREDLSGLDDARLWEVLRASGNSYAHSFNDESFDDVAVYVIVDGTDHRWVWRVWDRATETFGAVQGGRTPVDEVTRVCRKLALVLGEPDIEKFDGR